MYLTEQSVRQNLEDAGCESEMIQHFLQEGHKQDYTECIRMLKMHRRFLLEKLHHAQKKIDCLDYLVYQLMKEQEK